MNRRLFLQSAGLILAAPAIVRADSLMRVVPWDAVIDVPSPLSYSFTTIAARDAHAPSLNSGDFCYVIDRGDGNVQLYIYQKYSGPNVYGHHFHEIPA